MTRPPAPPGVDELIDACQVLSAGGHNDLTLGHVSLRDAEGRGFWLKRPGRGLDEVTSATDFHLLGWDGSNADHEPVHIEWPIHAGILQARPDVQVVGHTHPYWGHLASCRAEAPRLLGNEGAAFTAGLPLFTVTPDLIRTAELGKAVGATLGAARALLLAHHGVVFVGRSVAEAVLTGYWLEKLCRANLILGEEVAAVGTDVLAEKATRTFAEAPVQQHWSYLRRTLPPRQRAPSSGP